MNAKFLILNMGVELIPVMCFSVVTLNGAKSIISLIPSF